MSSTNSILFEELANEWLNQKRIVVKTSTYVKYRNTLEKHILPALGDYPLNSLDNKKLTAFVNSKLGISSQSNNRQLANKTIKDLLLIVNNILKYGRTYYSEDLSVFEIAYPTVHKNEIRILSPIEQRALEEVLYQDMDNIKLGILLCLYTGLRLGEICGLRWEDISICEAMISVKRTVQRLQTFSTHDNRKTYIHIDTPKSSNSIRKIPIPEFILPVIQKYYSEETSNFILSGRSDMCIEPRTLENKFHTFMDDALRICEGTSKYYPQSGTLTFHSLRHTFATRCVEAGFEIKWPGHKGFYVDDRTVRPNEFLDCTVEQLEEICNKSKEMSK